MDAWLDQKRLVGDPLADAAAREIVASGMPRGGDPRIAFEACVRNATASADASRACRELLRATEQVPEWVSFPKMLRASELGLRHPVQSGLALLLGSLVESYASAHAAKVLIRSGELATNTIKRLRDTTAFVMHIASSRGVRPGSVAHRHVLKVRLIHAFVRAGMQNRRDYDPAWGLPINQEDYATTLLMFCHVYLRGLRALGVRVTDDDEASVHHLYRWVGHVMGVDTELLTESRDEERALYEIIGRRQARPSADGRALAQSLISEMASRPPLFLPAGALEAISRTIVGDALADGFGFGRSLVWSRTIAVLPWMSRAQDTLSIVPGMGLASEIVGERLARVMAERGLTGRRSSQTGHDR